jgi:large subunit ribosomal protein L11
MVEKTLSFIVPGGKATGGPPIGPALGPLGVNIIVIVNKINELTAEYDGTPIPVDVTIDTDTKEFEVKVGMLSTFALITQTLKIDKGSGLPHQNFVGDLTFEQLINVAIKKRDGLLAASLKAAVNEVLGTCKSMGVTIDGKPVREIQNSVKAGEYDTKLVEVA